MCSSRALRHFIDARMCLHVPRPEIARSLPEIFIHGLGAAIANAAHVARVLTEEFGAHLELRVQTGTVEVIDDFEPLHDNLEPVSIVRLASAIHIRVRKQLTNAVQLLPPVKRKSVKSFRVPLVPAHKQTPPVTSQPVAKLP